MKTIGEFITKFGLKPSEFNGLNQKDKAIVAREFLRWKHDKRDTGDQIDEIINSLVFNLNF